MDEIHFRLDKYSSFHFLPFVKLLNDWDPLIPDIQRTFNQARVNHFIDVLVKHLEESEIVYNLNPIQLARLDGKYYILDGQHRFRAYQKLLSDYDLQEFESFRISVIVRDTNTRDELKMYFSDLNHHYISDDLETNVNKMDSIVELKNYFRTHYSSYISSANRPKFPNISLDPFVKFVSERFPIDTITKFEKANEDLGIYLSTYESSVFHKIAIKNPTKPLFFVHIFGNKQPRVGIPSTVRRTLWENKFAEELRGNCFVCKTAIDFHSFHVGHIIAVANGGTNQINNLECVCVHCNLSMGIQNLHEFKNKYF